MKIISIILFLLSFNALADQTVFGRFKVSSTSKASQSCPKMTEAQRDLIASPESGDCVYNSTTLSLNVYNGSAWKAAGGGVNQWLTATSYQLNDVVIQSNKFYICLVGHTSGTFATDLAASRWQLIQASIKVKAQAGTSQTVEELQFPNNQLTQTASGKYLVPTGNNNLIANSSFEHESPSSSWNASAGTLAQESSIVVHGDYSLKVTLSAQTLALTQDSTRYAAQFADGVQGVASIRIKTSVSGIFVCSRRAGATVLSNCATVNNDNKWLLYKVPYVFGATSNGIAIVSGTMTNGVVTTSAVTGDVYVDDAYVGTDAGIADTSIVTPWQSYTPTVTGFGTVTSMAGKWRQVGSSIEVEATWINGTVAASLASITLPNSYSLDSNAITRANTTAAAGSIVGWYQNAGASNAGSIVTATGTSTTLLYFGLPITSAANQVPQNGSSISASSVATAVRFQVPIANLAGSTQVFASSCGASCENVLSAKFTSSGVLLTESVDWINGNCSVSTNTFTCTPNTGVFTVIPACTISVYDAASAEAVYSNSSTASSLIFRTFTSGGSNTAYSYSISCQKQGADYQSSRTLVASIKEVMTAPGITKPKTCFYKFGGASATLAAPTECTTGTCIEVEDSCGTISPPARTAQGVYSDMTIAAGTFANSSPIRCDCAAYDTTINILRDCAPFFTTADQTWSTTSTGGGVYNFSVDDQAGASNQDGYVSIECKGQAP